MFCCWNNCNRLASVNFPSALLKLPTNKRIEGRIRKRSANRKNGITPNQFFQSDAACFIFLGAERAICAIVTTSHCSIGVRPRQMAGSHWKEQIELVYGAAFTSAPTALSQFLVMRSAALFN